uniref:PWWP domain-containing protein n=1 Tax=Anopheles epiroticus TaxID=199890 RepID=A0A182PH26_9DIPT
MDEELSDGDIVWVKVSNSWWPGEVMGDARLSEEFLSSLRKKPLAVVKFFQEDSYEYVKNPNFIFKYNCPRKHEFLRKGLEQYRAKMKHMEKFPADVMHAERATGGDPDIVNSTDFLPQKKERHSGTFQDGRTAAVKGKGTKDKLNTPVKLSASPFSLGTVRKTIHEVRILAQSSNTPGTNNEAGTSPLAERVSLPAGVSSAQSSPGQVYHCYKCNNYSAQRQNLIMLHIKHCRAAVGGTPSSVIVTTPIASLRKVPSEKLDESDEEENPEPNTKLDNSRRSLTTAAGEAKPIETPNRNIDLLVPIKSEPPNEKRTRGGLKSTPIVELPKQKKITARRRTKRGHSPLDQDEDLLGSTKISEIEEKITIKNENEKEEKQRLKTEKENLEVSTGLKNKTDVKLKNELLADWSEDEQDEDDGGHKEEEQVASDLVSNAPVKENRRSTPSKEVSPVRPTKASTKKQNQQKELKPETMKQPTASKKAIKTQEKKETTEIANKDDEESVVEKETEKDSDRQPEGNVVVTETPAAVLVSVATSASADATVVPTVPTTSTAPVVSPYATIKYRNIPKKQKREFIEVTNDDMAMVQEKCTVPSREGSTASTSSTTGSNESCTGTPQSAVAPMAPATEQRPISAKQLILNRATRGSSKSLSGDEHTPGTATVAVDGGNSPASTEERKSQSTDPMKKTDTPQPESSCFDFNDDEEEQQEKVSPASQKATIPARFDGRRREQTAVRQKPTTPEPDQSKDDRDTQLSQEIDSLLCETDVPKLPEDLNDVITAVSDKIDCNRTLPPKERGKRIFKTRNKTVDAASSSSPKIENVPAGGEAVQEETVPAEATANSDIDSCTVESNAAKENSAKVQASQPSADEEMRADKDDSKQEIPDHQNPAVTSSAMTDEITKEGQEPQYQTAKPARKSEEVLLPDSSGNGDRQPVSASRRRTKPVAEKNALQVSEARESSSLSRKAKRPRREITPNAGIRDKRSADGESATERVDSSDIETSAPMDTDDVTDSSATANDEPRLEVQYTVTSAKHSKQKRSEDSLEINSLALKASPTDLQVAEALINLPAVVSTAPLPVSSTSSPSQDEKSVTKETVAVIEPVRDADTVASSSSNNTSTSGNSTSSSTTKSINPRKRHLQTMITVKDQANMHQPKKDTVVEAPSSADSFGDEITSVKVVLPPEEDPPSIPEKKKRHELPIEEMMASKESFTALAEATDNFDINSMPIVLDASELLVDETSSVPNPVVKSINGAGTGAKPVITGNMKDKRQTTVAMVKGGKASTEQIVITSKGTVLTTSTASVSVASKFPSSSKSSVNVTSAITLSSNCRVASSTPTLAPNGSPPRTASTVSSPPSAASSVAAPQLVAPKIIITKKPLPHTASTSKASPKPGSVEGRRVSGEEASSSVSSSSGNETTGKKNHRVLRLTPQKLKEFSRLGYIEERQGKGKMLTKSGMRQLKKPVPISTKIIATSKVDSGGSDTTMALDSPGPTSLPEVASSGSNVVIAAAADSSVQESSTVVDRTAVDTDLGTVDMEEDEEMQKVSSEMVAPVGAAILLDGDSPSSSGTGGAATELSIVGGGSVTEASSSSNANAAGVQESSQLIAVPAENFGGPPHLFYLCSVRDESLVPVNNELLYLDSSNQLVALPEQHQQHPSQQQGGQHQSQQVAGALAEDIINQAEVILPSGVAGNGAELGGDGTGESGATDATGAVVSDGTQEGFVFNTQDGQHIIFDQQSLMALAAEGETPHLITADGQQILLQESAQEWLAALSAGQQQQTGALSTLVTPEGTQIIVAHENAGLIELQEHPVLMTTEIIQVNPNTTIETNAVLTKPPIMSTVEVPTKNGIESGCRTVDKKASGVVAGRVTAVSTTVASGGKPLTSAVSPGSTSTNLDETLAAVIGHVPSNPHVPTSLELPITVTNPVIAKTSTASSRLNAAASAQLFPLTTMTTTAVSSFAADSIPAAATATVVLVSGADAPGTIDRVPHPRSPSPLDVSCSSPSTLPMEKKIQDNVTEVEEEVSMKESEEQKGMIMVQEEVNGEGENEDDGCIDALGKETSASVEEDDIQIPNTPESAQNCDERQQEQEQQQQQQQHDDELMACDGEQYEPNENRLLLENENSNCSEIIAIQPNVVVLDGAMLLNEEDDEDDDDDDGIDDEMVVNDSEEENILTVRHAQQQEFAQVHVVQARAFDQRAPQQHHRSRNNAPSAANGRRDTANLADHHNNSSNNDSGIDTSMASGTTVGGPACEVSISPAVATGTEGSSSTERRTILER